MSENFRTYEDHDTYFLTQDALNSVSFDLFFSPIRRYYCDANCSVCYIKDILDESKQIYHTFIPDKITSKDEERWYDIFSHFYTLRMDDDFRYIKKHFPYVFGWMKEHAGLFQFCGTDNTILLQHDIVIDDMDLKGIADMSFSEEFLNRPNIKTGKIKEAISNYLDKYGMCKIKIIRTEQGEMSGHILDLVNWLSDKGVVNHIQQDLRTEYNMEYDLHGTFDSQNTYYTNYKNKPYQIFREAHRLMNDRWFFNVEDATNIRIDPIYTMPAGSFNADEFLPTMVQKKLEWYSRNTVELESATDPVHIKMREYFRNTSKFKVNNDFNFIPKFMLPSHTQFYHRLLKNDYISTEHGLIKKGVSKITPIVEFVS